MLAAVDFDDNSRPMAGEIGEVGTDRCLSPKVVVSKRRLPQMLPKFLFGFGRVTTQRASAGNALVNRTLCSMWHPPPTPDPSPPRASRAGGGAQIRAGQIPIQNCSHYGPSAAAPPASVFIQASPQALASSRTRMM